MLKAAHSSAYVHASVAYELSALSITQSCAAKLFRGAFSEYLLAAASAPLGVALIVKPGGPKYWARSCKSAEEYASAEAEEGVETM